MITATPAPPADPTAVIGRRILAWSIDFIILAVILVVVWANVSTSQDVGSDESARLACTIVNETNDDLICINAGPSVILTEVGDVGMLVLVAFVYGLATNAILPGLTGFSPGKAIVGLRIVRSESFERAGMGANLLRWLLWIVDGIPFLAPLVGFVTGLASSGHRRVGDMAAKTLVVDKKWVGQPLPVAGVNSVPMMAPTPAPSVAAPFGTPPPPPPGSAIAAPPPAAAVPPPPSGSPLAPATPTVMPPAPPAAPSAAPPPPPMASPTPPPPDPTAPIAPPAMPVAPDPEPEPEPIPEPIPEPDATAAVTTPTVALEPDPEPEPPAQPDPLPQPGVDAPQWDEARDTYIQYDPELAEWMEWNETRGAWIPISR